MAREFHLPSRPRVLRRLWRRVEWPFVGFLVVAALALGLVGFSRHSVATGAPRSGWDLLYLTLQLFVLESGSVAGAVPWELEVARFLAPAVAAYTAVRAVALLFGEELERLRVRLRRNHVLVCGLGRKGLLLATALRARGERVAVIEENAKNELIESVRSYQIPVLAGDARSPDLLRKARAQRASYLVAVTGDDGINAEIAVHARALTGGRRGRLSCLAHIVDPRLCDLLRMEEIGRPDDGGFRLDFFNVYQSGARALLADYPVVARSTGTESATARILVVGLGQFGQSVVVEAARSWKERESEALGGLTVTVVDRHAEQLTNSLGLAHPWLRSVARIEPKQMTLESSEFDEARFLFDRTGRSDLSAAYVCTDDNSTGLRAGLVLHRHLKPHQIPVVVRMAHHSGLAALLLEPGGGFPGLYAFPLLDRTCSPELLFAGVSEALARAIHQEYLEDQRRRGATRETNAALAPWEELAEDFKESNRSQARHVGAKLADIGCDIVPLGTLGADGFQFSWNEIERLAELEHERWVEERRRAGWKLGPKDAEHKRSPYLIPWSELSEEVRDYDRNFIRTLPRILAHAGYAIVRSEGAGRSEG